MLGMFFLVVIVAMFLNFILDWRFAIGWFGFCYITLWIATIQQITTGVNKAPIGPNYGVTPLEMNIALHSIIIFGLLVWYVINAKQIHGWGNKEK